MRDYIVSTETLRALGGYNEGRSLFEDYELLLKLARDHEFYCTGEFGTAYTEGGGLSQVDAKETDMIHDEIINKELERVDESTRRSILFRRKLLKIKRRIRSLI